MNLVLSVTDGILLDRSAARITVTTSQGAHTLLPRHADVAMVLVPGLMRIVDLDGEETFVAVHHGVLVKTGSTVRIASDRAVVAGTLADATEAVRVALQERDRRERQTRAALRRLEADLFRRIGALEGAS